MIIRVRETILDVIQLPSRHPELFQSRAPRRKGILLFGPPGTGTGHMKGHSGTTH